MIRVERAKLLCAALGCLLLLSLAPGLPASATWLLSAGTRPAQTPASERIGGPSEDYRLLDSAPGSLAVTSAPTIQSSLTVTETAALLGTTNLFIQLPQSDLFLPLVVR